MRHRNLFLEVTQACAQRAYPAFRQPVHDGARKWRRCHCGHAYLKRVAGDNVASMHMQQNDPIDASKSCNYPQAAEGMDCSVPPSFGSSRDSADQDIGDRPSIDQAPNKASSTGPSISSSSCMNAASVGSSPPEAATSTRNDLSVWTHIYADVLRTQNAGYKHPI